MRDSAMTFVPLGPLAAAAPGVRCCSDDEVSVQCIPGWDIQCLQLTAGVLAGQAVDLYLQAIQVLFEEYRNVSTGHSGSAPSGALIFGVATGMKGNGLLNGVSWGDGVNAFDARRELHSVVPPGGLISLVVGRRALNDYVWHTEHVDLEHWLSPEPGSAQRRRDRASARRPAAGNEDRLQGENPCIERPSMRQRLVHECSRPCGAGRTTPVQARSGEARTGSCTRGSPRPRLRARRRAAADRGSVSGAGAPFRLDQTYTGVH
jgi:hypothetical protein